LEEEEEEPAITARADYFESSEFEHGVVGLAAVVSKRGGSEV